MTIQNTHQEHTRTREEWRPVPRYEGIYEVSDLGRVRRISSGRILIGDRSNRGYVRVTLCDVWRDKRRRVHQIVAEAFIGPRPPGMVINHKNAVRDDNRPSNLEYVTHAENQQHAAELGLFPRGTAHRNAKLSPAAVRYIRLVYAPRCRTNGCRALARRLGLDRTTVRQVIRGHTWRHVI